MLLAAVAASCADLSPLPSGACGNAVIDPGEDCDTHATEAGSRCAPAGDARACRFVCGPTSGDATCPTGFGCGQDGLCRRPTGTFAKSGALIPFASPHDLRTADFDGDGKSDFLLLGELDALGRSPAHLAFPGGSPAAPQILDLPLPIAAPAIGDVDGNGTFDLAFAGVEGISLVDSLHPSGLRFAPFPSFLPPEGHFLRVIPLPVTSASRDQLVHFIDRRVEGGVTLERPAGADQPGAILTYLPGGEDDLTGEIRVASLDEGAPCQQIILPYASEVVIFTPCRSGPLGPEWNVGGTTSSVKVPPSTSIDGGVIPVDLDLDQHIDLLIGAGGQTYVAWGLGDGAFEAQKPAGAAGEAGPFPFFDTKGNMIEPPLAVADIDLDGALDLVVPTGVLLARPAGYTRAASNQGSPWSEALIADFNANGLPDIVAGSTSALNLDVLNNAGAGLLNPFTLPTDAPVAHLAAGDFDGDLVNDLAFAQKFADHDTLSVGFGAAQGPPSTLLTVAHTGSFEQLRAARLPHPAGLDAVSDLLAVSENEETATDGVFTFRGDGARAVRSTLPLDLNGVPHLPIALAAGSFSGAGREMAALGADTDSGELRLWRIAWSRDLLGFDRPEPSAPLPASFHPSSGAGTITFRYGAFMQARDLDGDGADELIMVGSHGPPGSAALLVADYDGATSTFQPRPEQPFPADLTDDSTLQIVDVDGDHLPDALVTTGSDEEPGELVILWGNIAGALSADNPARITIEGGLSSATCIARPSAQGCDLFVIGPKQAARAVVTPGRSITVTPLPEIEGGIRIAGADVDDDGLIDLAIQNELGLQVYRAIPERP
ncbi:MAG: FG-GAP-like repeat-containing protein [Byssovorax sp.]